MSRVSRSTKGVEQGKNVVFFFAPLAGTELAQTAFMPTQQQKRREFEQATIPCLNDLYSLAMRLTRNPHDAQDLVQETYLRAYSAWERFEPADCHRQAASSESPGSCARPWLVRIMTNSFINQYRRGRSHKRFVQRPGDEPMSAFFGDETRQRARDPESWYLHDSMGDELTSALASLPDGYRKIVLLACVEELKYREIADMLGIPVGTVMSRLFRARQKLEEKLASHVVTEERLRAA